MQTRNLSSIVVLCLALMTTACATTSNKDPFEGYNRAVYKFNDVADKAVVKPIAGAYKAVAPSPVRTGVNNFFSNLGTLVTAVNDLLQLKVSKAFQDIGRFTINTTFGVAGLIDVASMDGIEKRREDFGQTLGYWGVGDGPYLVLPFFGPSNFRDTTGLVVDSFAFDPVSYIDDVRARNQTRLFRALDTRAQLLPASDLIDDAALDPYAFMRDAYQQRRRSQILDGASSESPEDDDDQSATK